MVSPGGVRTEVSQDAADGRMVSQGGVRTEVSQGAADGRDADRNVFSEASVGAQECGYHDGQRNRMVWQWGPGNDVDGRSSGDHSVLDAGDREIDVRGDHDHESVHAS